MRGCVVAVATDDGIAQVIELELADRGFTCSRHRPNGEDSTACIVVISNAAIGDPDWARTIESHRADRIVPVRYEEVDADDPRIPDIVRELNWLVWDPVEAPAFYDRLFVSLFADPQWRDERRVLESEASSWVSSGRRDDLLIENRSRIATAIQNLAPPVDHPSLRPSETLLAFIRRSGKYRRKLRRRRVGRILLRLILVAAIVWLFVLLKGALQQPQANNKLAANLSTTTLNDSRQDRVGLLAATLMIQSPNVPDATTLGFTKATRALASFWSSGYLNGQGATAITSGAMTADGAHFIAAEGNGSVSVWDTKSLLLTHRVSGTGVRVDTMATDSNGEHVALAGPSNEVTLVDVQTGNRTTAQLPAAALLLASLPDGGWAAGTDDALYHLSPSGAVQKVFSGKAIIAIGPTRTGVKAVVRMPDDKLALVDAESGHVLAQRDWPAYLFDKAALAPDSDAVAVIGNQGELYVADDQLDLKPTGHSVPDIATDLTFLAHNRVVLGSSQYGTQVIDLPSGLVVGRICTYDDTVAEVVADADGNLVACLDDIGAALWPIGEMAPSAVAPPASVQPGHASLTVKGVTFSGAVDGSVTVSTQGYKPVTYQYGTSAITDVEFRQEGPTLGIGTANGEVFEADLTSTGLVPVSDWQLPDDSPVESLTWAPDGSTFTATTAAGNSWTRASCSGCGKPGTDLLYKRVSARLWACYTPNQIEDIVGTARKILNVRTCPGS